MFRALVPSFTFREPGPPPPGGATPRHWLRSQALWLVSVPGNSRWRHPCRVPRREDLMGSCCRSHFPRELSLGRGNRHASVPPEGRSQGNAKEAGFNSEPRCQLLFPGASKCKEIYPCLLNCSPQQSRQGRGQREVESQRAPGTCLQLICWEVAGPHGGCCAHRRNGRSAMGCWCMVGRGR